MPFCTALRPKWYLLLPRVLVPAVIQQLREVGGRGVVLLAELERRCGVEERRDEREVQLRAEHACMTVSS